MRQVDDEAPELSVQALDRAQQALSSRKTPQPFDREAARAELDALTGAGAANV
jgi:beta-N-acetylhexosaminidase